MSDKKIDYITEWHKENTKIIPVRLNFETDRDILDKLNAVNNKSGYVKDLIRKDIKKEKEKRQ